METFIIGSRTVRDIAPLVLNEQGQLRIMPAQFYRGTTLEERAMFGVKHSVYGLPTLELVARLRELIGGRRAIEIGSGNGVLASALGIPATDNHQQADPNIQMYYRMLKQPTITYGPHVEKLDALDAVRMHRPEVVVACWVTHRFDPANPQAEGNQDGVREEDILANCDTYIFIGNGHVHRHKPIWRLPHTREEPDYVFSRAVNGSPNFIAVWQRATPNTAAGT